MRVHGDKVIRRQKLEHELQDYRDAKPFLQKDFHFLCGYCGKNGKIMHQKFHVDHFVPKSIDASREKDYSNLVLACPKCNLSKSDKWPTKDPHVANNGKVGFVDPATEEYDEHMKRDEKGYILGTSPLGENICFMLHLDIRRTDLYWKIEQIRLLQEEMHQLFMDGKLNEKEKDCYIRLNIILLEYINEAFEKGE